jgi:ribonucleoside-diphosphate reductase alpha chain
MPVRNCGIISIAPTGTISLAAECSSGIEPRFAASFKKDVIDDDGLDFLDLDLVSEIERLTGLSHDETIEIVHRHGSHLEFSEQIGNLFRYSHDISGHWYVATVAAWQEYTDSGISKIVEYPRQ